MTGTHRFSLLPSTHRLATDDSTHRLVRANPSLRLTPARRHPFNMPFLFHRSFVDPRQPTMADKFPMPPDQKREVDDDNDGASSKQDPTQQASENHILHSNTVTNRGKYSVKVVMKFNRDADEAADLPARMRRAEYRSNPSHYRRLLTKYATENAFQERSVLRRLGAFLSRQRQRFSTRRRSVEAPAKSVRFR